MTYTKQNFTNGQVLTAQQLNNIEAGIIANEDAIQQNAAALSNKQDKGNYVTGTQLAESLANKQDKGDYVTLDELNSVTSNKQDKGDYVLQDDLNTALDSKQDKLVNGSTIKTINGKSVLGGGDLEVETHRTVVNNEYTVNVDGTKDFYVAELNGDEVCDYYAINNKGEHVLTTGYGCTSYIDCYGCGEMQITMMQGTSATNYGLAFYDENKTFISFVPNLVGSEVTSVLQTVTIPENAHYFRTSFFNYEQQKQYGEFSCALTYKNDLISKDGKRPYQDGFIYFSQRVNQSITAYYDTSQDVANKGEYKVTTGVLALPTNYKPTGKKTPVILYAHGLSHYVYYGKWGNTDTFRTQKQHWLDMGFAVIGCNGARDNNRKGQFASGICPQGVNGYKQCLEYALEHYNLDPEVFLFAGSAGGAIGWNFLSMYGQCVKAAVFVSAYADIKADAWGGGNQKSLFKEFLGFDDTSVYEEDKTIGFDPIKKILTINSKKYCFSYYNTPIYGLYGSEDTYNLIGNHKAMFEALRNAGATAQLRRIEGVGHEIVSGANLAVDTEIGNWYLSHWGDTGKKVDLTTHTVTYRYVDSDGNEIQSDVVAQVLQGTTIDFTANKPNINGYSFVSVEPTSATITESITVTYVYEKIPTYQVTYKYVNESGVDLQTPVVEEVAEGTVIDFTANVPTFDNHAFISVTPTNATITQNTVVTYTYKESITYTVTYVYVDESGNTVKETETQIIESGTTIDFTANKPNINGYDFVSVTPTNATVTSNTTVTYVYAEKVIDETDLTSLFTWDRQKWMAVSNPQWKSSSNFMSCFTDLSAYVGKTVEFMIPQYTASNGGSSTGMTAWHTVPTEQASSLHTKFKIWDVDTNGNGKGILVPIQAVVPAEAPYLWTSIYMDGVAAYVGPSANSIDDFYCRIVG